MVTPKPTPELWNDAPSSALKQHWQHHAEKERDERQGWQTEEMEAAYVALRNIHQKGWRCAHYAPKDGTYFLGWDPSARYPYVCQWKVPDGESWTKCRIDGFVDGDVWAVYPTHWRRLPEGTPFYSEANERMQAVRENR